MQEDGTDGAAHAPVAVYAVTTGTQRLARPVEEGRVRAREQAPQRMPAVDAGTHGVDVRLPRPSRTLCSSSSNDGMSPTTADGPVTSPRRLTGCRMTVCHGIVAM